MFLSLLGIIDGENVFDNDNGHLNIGPSAGRHRKLRKNPCYLRSARYSSENRMVFERKDECGMGAYLCQIDDVAS